MAFDINKKFIDEYNRSKYNYLRFKLSNWQNIYRFRKCIGLLKSIFNLKKKIQIKDTFNYQRNDFYKISNFYKQNKFCFIENIFNSSFYEKLLTNLPNKYFFQPPRIIEKQYNFGFKYISDDANYQNVDFKYFYELEAIFKQLKSSNFSLYLKKFLEPQSENKFKMYSFISTIAGENSILFCHKDSITNLKEETTLSKKNSAINLIFFVKGKDYEDNCGATGIYRSNDFSDPIFVPKILNNSLLIYKSDANFYHGFDIMKKNTYRFTINSQFIYDE